MGAPSFGDSDYQKTQKRVPDHMCARCRRSFQVGDRVQHAFILLDPNAYNPDKITERGLMLGTDCEFVHCDCEDPQLLGKRAGRLIIPAS